MLNENKQTEQNENEEQINEQNPVSQAEIDFAALSNIENSPMAEQEPQELHHGEAPILQPAPPALEHIATVVPVSQDDIQSALAEPSPATTPAAPLQPVATDPTVAPVHIANYVAPIEKKSHKGLIIGLVSVFVLLLGTAGGFAGWYFGIRTADSEYDKAIASVDAMIADAKTIESKRRSNSDISVNATVTSVRLTASDTDTSESYQYAASAKKLSDLKGTAAEYMTNVTALQSSAAVTKDASVKAVLDTNQKVISEYGSSSDTAFKTMYIFYTMLQYCSAASDSMSDAATTLASYDLAAKPCRDYLTANTTVPSKDFSDTFYVPYRKIMIGVLDKAHDYLAATTKAQQTTAENALLQLIDDLSAIDTSKVDTVDTSPNPSSQLQRVHDKLVERKAVFFR